MCRAARHDQLLLRAGHGDIENTQLLRDGLCRLAVDDGSARKPMVIRPACKVDDIAADQKLLVRQNSGSIVLHVHLPRQIGQNDDREFQSLGFVDGHDAHGVRPGGRVLRGQSCAALLHLKQQLHKLGQDAKLCLCASRHERRKCSQTAAPPFAVRQSGKDHFQPGGLHDGVQQFRQRRPAAFLAHTGKPGQKRAQLFRRLPAGAQAVVKVCLLRLRAKQRQLLWRKAEDGACHGCSQRNIPVRVIDNLQKLE